MENNPKEEKRLAKDLLEYAEKIKRKREQENSLDNLLENINLKPLELESYLKQHVIDQDLTIQLISTKVCTHYNRLKLERKNNISDIKGNIKNNMLLIGPTGVGKTFIIKLIADKLKLPFSKGDATKYSETGYIGGDVTDLIRNLYYSCDNDIEKAEIGIVYVDEIDKIASVGTRGYGPDVSRGGVQRSLLKLMEESEVDIKTPHDMASQMESLIQVQKTGKASRKTINTKNILFILSGAFDSLSEIINIRLNKSVIGFKSDEKTHEKFNTELYKNVIPDDLIKYGFDSEFVGRLPILAVLNTLSEDSLYKILNNPYSSIINSKKRDFESYGINLIFEDDALKTIAELASKEKTGARSLIRIIENSLFQFERLLPSTNIDTFTVTKDIITEPNKEVESFIEKENLKHIIEDMIIPYRMELNTNNE